jgi:adenine-specific DNA-methyltransferase
MQFKIDQTAQKLRGGYYTPQDLALFISRWVTENDSCRNILEPSCGDGNFLEAIAKSTRRKINVDAFEIEQSEVEKAVKRSNEFSNINANIFNKNFLEWFLKGRDKTINYDAVVGNPPFIRYQYLPENSQTYAELIYEQFGLPFRRHTNAWVPFVVASVGLLKPGGRLGMVIPAEIMHVMHAQVLRYYLGTNCSQILIFDPEDLWFEGTLQGAVILLAEKKKIPSVKGLGVGIVRTVGKDFVKNSPSSYFDKAEYINGKTIEGKWTRAILNSSERDVFDSLTENTRVFPFGEIADVDVGLVTGANSFFLVNEETVKKYDLSKWAFPMFGRSEHCPGVIYDELQHAENSRKGLPTNFIWFKVNGEKDLNSGAKKYVTMGEDLDLHKRYKCRIRKPWYTVPSVYITQIGMLKRAHDIPRLIYNELGAYTTDTAYRIKTSQVAPDALVYCFVNSLTALSAELEGRHYGGGVLELVPSEIEKMIIPIPKGIKPNLKKLDKDFRKMKIDDILHEQDTKVLEGIGLNSDEQGALYGAWYKLRCRRQRINCDEDC